MYTYICIHIYIYTHTHIYCRKKVLSCQHLRYHHSPPELSVQFTSLLLGCWAIQLATWILASFRQTVGPLPPPLADAKNATDLETLDSVDWRKPSATQVGYVVGKGDSVIFGDLFRFLRFPQGFLMVSLWFRYGFLVPLWCRLCRTLAPKNRWEI